jgi:succinate dehydrogenase/fumarate reductase-like Fe-S protein
MVEVAIDKTVVRVRRGGPGDSPRFDEFEVPFENGMSVLDALRWIRIHRDSTLAIRYSCINANACKTCMALVDGQVEYTCIAKLPPGIVTVEPLPKRRLIRDLVTDVVPDEEKALLAREQPD